MIINVIFSNRDIKNPDFAILKKDLFDKMTLLVALSGFETKSLNFLGGSYEEKTQEESGKGVRKQRRNKTVNASKSS